MQEATQWWLDTDEAITPFDEIEGNPYVLEDGAEEQVDRSEAADDTATQFDLATVLLALTLFVGGVATLFRWRIVTWLLLGVSVGMLGLGCAVLFSNFPA